MGNRCDIVLLAHQGRTPTEIARRLGVSRPTVALWLQRYVESGHEALEGNLPRGRTASGVPNIKAAEVIRLATETTPEGDGRWTVRALAAEVGISPSSVCRTLKAHGIY